MVHNNNYVPFVTLFLDFEQFVNRLLNIIFCIDTVEYYFLIIKYYKKQVFNIFFLYFLIRYRIKKLGENREKTNFERARS